MHKFNETHTVKHNLSSIHLNLAINSLYDSREEKNAEIAISSIIHGYCGLEADLNSFGYEFFDDKDSELYIDSNNRDLPLNHFINKWNKNLGCLEKIKYIFSKYSISLDPRLENELRELNNYRNWLIHGFSYKTTFLLQPIMEEENKYDVVDIEEDVDWKEKFPNTKFNSIMFINSSDAEKALKIVLKVFVLLSTKSNHIYNVFILKNKIGIKLINNNKSIEEIINLK